MTGAGGLELRGRGAVGQARVVIERRVIGAQPKDEDAQLVRKRRGLSARCSAALDYLSSLSPCVTVLTLFFITFPPIFYDRIFLPCWVR